MKTALSWETALVAVAPQPRDIIKCLTEPDITQKQRILVIGLTQNDTL